VKLHELSLQKAQQLLKDKEISSTELTRAVLERIHAVEDRVGAFITVSDDMALGQAEAADKRISAGDIAPLTGIPLAIKDVVCTRGLNTTCGSKILENYISPYDATVMEKLYGEGAVMVGKANMDEFAMGSTTENSAYKPTRNPWNLDYIPGGSSGGSAAAVAADMCLAALGSDTGGSIRQPGSHCGVVGLKPTYGRVSRFGLVAFGSSLDQIGPLTKNVSDAAVMLNAISGHDPRDSTSVLEPVPDFTRFLEEGLKGVRLGIPKEYQGTQGLDPDVAANVAAAIAQLEALGAETVEVSLPHTEYAVAAYYIIATSEASSNLARYDGVKYGYRDDGGEGIIQMYRRTRSKGLGEEVRRRIILGTYALSAGYYDAYYGKASQIRTLIMADYKKAFENCDVIVSPVAPTPAFRIGEVADDPLTMYLSDVFTLSTNLAGICGLSVPCGFSTDGLPIGLQITGNHFQEGKLLTVGYNYEQSTDYHHRKPEL
jgi:aspartyl-tRNA(Asn)/glutamyl-tRNA(Gln) amidotransferase subunit A